VWTSPGLWQPNGIIWVRRYNRTSSPQLEGCPLHISKYSLNLQQKVHLNLSHTPLTRPWALERRLELIFGWALSVQSNSTSTSSSTTSIAFVSLRDSSPRWLGIAWELPSAWLSPDKFVLPSSSWGLIVKSQTRSKWSFGEDLGLRAIQSFVGSSTETYVALWCRTSEINHCLSCLLLWFTFEALVLTMYI
jgi:hypothetical protein